METSALRPADRSELADRLGAPELFQQTVPRRLVHRSAVSEVLVTGVRQGPESTHQVGAQWPRGHSFYGPIAGRWHDPMIFAETIRQACVLLAHQTLGIPLAHKFLTVKHSFAILAKGVHLASRPADVMLEISLHDVVRRGHNVSSFACSIDAYRDGEPIGTGDSAARCVSPTVYQRLRGHRLDAVASRSMPSPVPPESVGRKRACDVVLGLPCGDGNWVLRFDASHPVLFDHPVDHVPGMVLMEAARQAALLSVDAPNGLLLACAADFRRYIEFDTPCVVSAHAPQRVAPGMHVQTITFHQARALAGSCRVTVLGDAAQ